MDTNDVYFWTASDHFSKILAHLVIVSGMPGRLVMGKSQIKQLGSQKQGETSGGNGWRWTVDLKPAPR